jgi:hypothetical protein
MARPRKIKHPIGLDVALRFYLPKKRPEHRRKIFRAWRRTCLKANLKREPTEHETEADARLFREPEFDAANCRFGFWDLLKDFVPVYQKENRRKKAQIAAAKRWSKKSEKSHRRDFCRSNLCRASENLRQA